MHLMARGKYFCFFKKDSVSRRKGLCVVRKIHLTISSSLSNKLLYWSVNLCFLSCNSIAMGPGMSTFFAVKTYHYYRCILSFGLLLSVTDSWYRRYLYGFGIMHYKSKLRLYCIGQRGQKSISQEFLLIAKSSLININISHWIQRFRWEITLQKFLSTFQNGIDGATSIFRCLVSRHLTVHRL